MCKITDETFKQRNQPNLAYKSVTECWIEPPTKNHGQQNQSLKKTKQKKNVNTNVQWT